jgi:cysteine desulfurase family protein
MIYFDNAATGGYKPSSVYDSASSVMRFLCANPSRSSHRLAISGSKIVYSARCAIAKAFNSAPERVVFTKNCTEALNIAITSSLKKGGHVITTVYEHNSVLRPLFTLKDLYNLEIDVVAPINGQSLSELIKKKIQKNTCLIVMTSISNVTGEVLNFKEVGKIASEFNIPFIVDGAQGGGHVEIDLQSDHIDYLALAGHKGLYGIMGSGALVFSEKVFPKPIMFGGTGTDTFSLVQPLEIPENLEVGTVNLPAIAALKEGVLYASKNIKHFNVELTKITQKIIDGLKEIKDLTLYSLPNPSGIVSFKSSKIDSIEFSDILNKKYDIAVRGGFHCAPLIHKHLKTDSVGLVRISASVHNSASEVNHLIRSIEKICKD